MSLEPEVREAFAQDGVLSHAAEQFREREGQTQMALAVARTIDQGGVLVVEAGTGVGKTFSYLVPALLSGERVLLSTATKTLQDQLFGRDLPRLVEALGLPVRTALLKGRASYLCLHRLDLARHDASLPERGSLRTLAKIEQWSQGHPHRRPGRAAGPGRALAADSAGDLHARELPGRAVPAVQALPRQPGAARGDGGRRGGHQPPPVLRRPGGARIGHGRTAADGARGGLRRGAPAQRDRRAVPRRAAGQRAGAGFRARHAGRRPAAGARPGRLAAARGRRRARRARPAAGGRQAVARRQAALDRRGARRRAAPTPGRTRSRPCSRPSRRPRDGARHGQRAVARFRAPARARAAAGASAPTRFAEACAAGSVRWVDVGTQLRLVESPLDIAEAVRTRVLKSRRGRGRRGSRARAWVFTSATLGDDPKLRWFTEPCGLDDAEVLRVQQPVRLRAARRRCTCRAHLPSPTIRRTARRSRSWPRAAPRVLGGRTLVLTTTLRALRAIGDALQAAVRAAGRRRGRRCWCRASCPSAC